MEEKDRQQEEQTKVKPKKNFVFKQIQDFIFDRMELRYNIVKCCNEFRKRGEDNYDEFTDRYSASLLIELKEDSGIKFTKGDYELILNSKMIKDYDPYKEYFESLPMWNGEDKINELARYIKVEDAENYKFNIQLKKWLVRVVKCALDNSYLNKQMLVFVGETQNTGKSTFCRWLCPTELKQYFSEESLRGKDESIQLTSNLFILYDEMAKLNLSGLEEVKETLAKLSVKFRPPYARTEQTFYRRCSFMGNTNQTQFLTDDGGSVRFLCFLLKEIDFDYSIKIDINDIWSQAFHLYKSGFNCEMTREEIEAQQQYNRQFYVTSTEHDLILEYIRPATQEDINSSVTVVYQWQAGQILQFLQEMNPTINLKQVTLGKSLKFLKFERKKIKQNNTSKYIYQLVLNKDSFIREDLKKCFLPKKNK